MHCVKSAGVGLCPTPALFAQCLLLQLRTQNDDFFLQKLFRLHNIFRKLKISTTSCDRGTKPSYLRILTPRSRLTDAVHLSQKLLKVLRSWHKAFVPQDSNTTISPSISARSFFFIVSFSIGFMGSIPSSLKKALRAVSV